jgi:hypothetical protein
MIQIQRVERIGQFIGMGTDRNTAAGRQHKPQRQKKRAKANHIFGCGSQEDTITILHPKRYEKFSGRCYEYP